MDGRSAPLPTTLGRPHPRAGGHARTAESSSHGPFAALDEQAGRCSELLAKNDRRNQICARLELGQLRFEERGFHPSEKLATIAEWT